MLISRAGTYPSAEKLRPPTGPAPTSSWLPSAVRRPSCPSPRPTAPPSPRWSPRVRVFSAPKDGRYQQVSSYSWRPRRTALPLAIALNTEKLKDHAD
ncbi:hypothetical protein [Streptomyces bullii]|uniref:Uncharacterized protein n=1 Tax=Streptomyces bullii TaxID=349910 RepID=A0ABW0URR6_9ACTN